MNCLLWDLGEFKEFTRVQALWKKPIGQIICEAVRHTSPVVRAQANLAQDVGPLKGAMALLEKYKVYGMDIAYAELLSLIEDPTYSLQRGAQHEDCHTQLQVVIPDPKALVYLQHTLHGEGGGQQELWSSRLQMRERAEKLREEVLSLDSFDLRDVDPIEGRPGIVGFKSGNNGVAKDLLLEFLGSDLISRYQLEVWSFDGLRIGAESEFAMYRDLFLYPEKLHEEVGKLPGVIVSNECNAGFGACLMHRAKKPGSYSDVLSPDMPGVARFTIA